MSTRCYCTALRTATRRVTAFYDDALAPVGIGVAQFSMLRKLEDAGRVTVSELGNLTDLERSTVSRNVRVLERLKLVKLERSAADHREMVVALSAEGFRALANAAPLWDRAQENIRTQIGAPAAEALLKMLAVV